MQATRQTAAAAPFALFLRGPGIPLQCEKWAFSILLYSAAVSIKMNVLLFAPGVLAVIVKVRGP